MGILDGVIKGFNQVGFAVRDVEETARFMEDALGIKVYTVLMPPAKAVLRGREVGFTVKLGLAHVGNIDLEFVEVVEGEHVVREFLDTRGPGIHHLGVYVDDFDSAVDRWTKAGRKLIQLTRHPGGIGTAYLDTEGDMGAAYIELIKL